MGILMFEVNGRDVLFVFAVFALVIVIFWGVPALIAYQSEWCPGSVGLQSHLLHYPQIEERTYADVIPDYQGDICSLVVYNSSMGNEVCYYDNTTYYNGVKGNTFCNHETSWEQADITGGCHELMRYDCPAFVPFEITDTPLGDLVYLYTEE